MSGGPGATPGCEALSVLYPGRAGTRHHGFEQHTDWGLGLCSEGLVTRVLYHVVLFKYIMWITAGLWLWGTCAVEGEGDRCCWGQSPLADLRVPPTSWCGAGLHKSTTQD